ncbi:MAG: hypothetical protein JWN87_841 [Frankiales bacterium]|nr:hypothetical protein [Frankiales bacterium]MCW2586914.1 hypothetical protein [Frankiales bacterium]
MLLVDAANVVGSVPDGWWRDRAGAARRLVDRLRRSEGLPDTTVVLEGAARRGAPEGTAADVQVVHAPGSGDDTLAELSGPGVTVVTADRGLAERVRAAGGDVVGPSWLRDRLPT